MKTLFQEVFILLCLIFLSALAFAEERTGDLAVLDISFTGKGLTKQQLEFLSDDIREKAVEFTGYRIMNKESIFAILKDKGIDTSKCGEAECEVEFGRIVQADKLVTSSLLLSGGKYYIKIKLYDVAKATLEKSVSKECERSDFSKLRQAVGEASMEVFGGIVEKEERIPQLPAQTGKGALLIETKPAGARIVLDGSPKGQTAEGKPVIVANITPGAHTLRAEHPDYETAEQHVEVAPDTQGKVELILAPKPGRITVSTSPIRAMVTIDGKETGESPQTAALQAGEHTVRVTAMGYKSQEKKVRLTSNSYVTVAFALEKGPSESQVGEDFGPEGTKEGPMVLIPAGEFLMGCNESADNDCSGDEKPSHKVFLNAYYIYKQEVTVAEYRQCVNAGRCKGSATGPSCNWGIQGRESHPINCVAWDDANSYCTWAGKRLPTEAEWERAARGTDGRIYPWGNVSASCRYAVMNGGGEGCGRGTTWPVCSKPEGNSPYSLCDMAGNVWEWVQDWYDENYYKNSPAKNPQGPRSGSFRVLRGGSWKDIYLWRLRASLRDKYRPSDLLDLIGFRCVLSVASQ